MTVPRFARSLAAIFALIIFSLGIRAQNLGTAPENYPASCTPGTNDTGCWQAAINGAMPGGSGTQYMGTVNGSSGKAYYISAPLVVCNAWDGVIDGHGAILYWKGGSNSPLFYMISTHNTRITNFHVISNSTYPLQAVIQSAQSNSNSVNAQCTGAVGVSSKLSVTHLRAEAQGSSVLNALNYGIRWTNPGTGFIDGNDDMSYIEDVEFNQVTLACLSIEHTQSQQHHFARVNCSGAVGNSGCYVNAPGYGSFTSVDGFSTNFGNSSGGAAFCVAGAYGTFNIFGHNSVCDYRMLYAPEAFAGYPVTVNIVGGQASACSNLASDGGIISFGYLGSITIKGMLFYAGTAWAGTNPQIIINPSMSGSQAMYAEVTGNNWYISGADTWNTLTVRTAATLNAQGNQCFHSTGSMYACQAPTRN